MADTNSRFGTALLALNTKRQPDLGRRTSFHLSLTTPAVIETQVELWESGKRGPIDPREAAKLLWSTDAAEGLDGRPDSWLDVALVSALRPGLLVLRATARESWPSDQAGLLALVAAENGDSAAGIMRRLKSSETVNALNDLVLVFKFAAIGSKRSIADVVDFYRLASALLAEDGPSSLAEVTAWLDAPLLVPDVFTAPSGMSGPRPPADPNIGDRPEPPIRPPFDFTSPAGEAILNQIEGHLDIIAANSPGSEITGTSVESVSASSPSVMANTPITSALTGSPRGGRAEVVTVNIAGSPVVIDTAALGERTAKARRGVAAHIEASLPQTTLERLENLGVLIEDLPIWSELIVEMKRSPSYVKPSGRSDLLLVRQTTTGYRRAEIAYIENVIIGETRERHHSDRVLQREELFESREKETEETKNLQATDRAELSREVNSVVSEDLKAEGNVKVTSRGPTKVVASAGVSVEHSIEEAATAAEEYARETIERSSKRMLERFKRETRSTFEHETTEYNQHKFALAGTAAENVSGVYQFLERVSRARIFSYGERELYDIVVPEPSALIWNLAIAREELRVHQQAPDEELFDSLTLDNIASKREEVISAFRVYDIDPVPTDSLTEDIAFSGTGRGENAKYATHKELQIPDGYVVTGARFVVSAEIDDGHKPNGGAVIGPEVKAWDMTNLSGNQGTAELPFTFTTGLPGPTVGVGVHAENFQSLAGNVTLELAVTDAHRQQWALDTYSRVAERFTQMQRDYEQAVAQAFATQPGEEVTLPEGSRRRLDRIVRFELQRAAIGLMRNHPADFDLVADHQFADESGELDSHPTADPAALAAAEPEVRFLQQAFEWEHLAWVLYPYFWGRRSQWHRTVVQAHPDSDFEAFLNAGSARLQIPVRPGFEGLVKHFMETGEVYEGGGLPHMGDSGYLPFIDEQVSSLQGPGEEIPWPPDNPREWNIVTPTPLVIARKQGEKQIPEWDPMTGVEVD